MTHVVVDPVTRIEGHLRIEAEVDGGKVQDAWSSATMFRGVELILKGRDPRDAWAFTQRICGVCTTVHAIASIRAVENAIGADAAAERPPPAQPDHLLAVRPGPRDSLLPPARARLGRHRVGALGRSGEDFRPGAVDLGLAAVEHDLLRRHPGPREGVRRARPARPLRQRLLGPPGLQAAAGGEPDGGRPLPRGARLAARVHPDPRDPRRKEPAPAELPRRRHGDAHRPGPAGLAERRIDRRDAGAHREGPRLRHAGLHPGPAGRRLLLQGLGRLRRRRRQLPGLRRVSGGRRPEPASLPALRASSASATSRRSRTFDPAKITEQVKHSWYEYDGGDDKGLHPFQGETKPKYTGPKPPYERLDDRRQVQLAEVPALRRRADGGRSALPDAGRVRLGPAARQGARRSGPREAQRRSRGPLLDARPRRRPGNRDPGPRREDGRLGQRARRQHGAPRAPHRRQLEVGARHLAEGGLGRRLPRGAPRRARPLGPHPRRPDRQLPVRRAEHLERRAARRRRQPRPIRGGPARHPGRTTPRSRSRSCGRCTRSTPASHAASTSSTHSGASSRT